MLGLGLASFEPHLSVHCSRVCHVHFLSHCSPQDSPPPPNRALDLCPVASKTEDPVGE